MEEVLVSSEIRFLINEKGEDMGKLIQPRQAGEY